MAVDERKRKGTLRGGGCACTWREEGSSVHGEEGAMNYHRTERGWEGNHPQAEDRKYRFYKEEPSVTSEEKGWRLKRSWIRWASRMERGENWEKSRRNSADDRCCWHCLYLFQSHWHTTVGKAGWELRLFMELWCQCSSMALFLHFVGQGWAGCAGGSESPGDVRVCIAPADWLLPVWDYPATALPAQPHCWSHGCPQARGQPPSVVQTKAMLLLRTSFGTGTMFKTESRGMYWVYFDEIRMSFSRDVSHWKLNLQSSVLSHPSSSLTSCALKLFCQSSDTFVSTLLAGQLASQKHSQRAARGRIFSSITVRCARKRIVRKTVACLINGDNSVVSFPPRRVIS